MAALLSAAAASCAIGPEFTASSEEATTKSFPEVAPRPPVYLTPGDVIEVKFLYWPELTEEQEIRPDGKIALSMVGHIDVSGATPEQLDTHLIELYRNKIKDPAITTIVRSFASRRVYVGGEVNTPGFVTMSDSMTALEAIMLAGGFDTTSASGSNVLVIRHADGQRYAKLLDFDRPINETQGELLYLAPRDIVYVPRTRIARVNQWVDQYITSVIPANIFVSVTRGNTAIGFSGR